MTNKIGNESGGERRMMGSLREALAAAGRSEGSPASTNMAHDGKSLPVVPLAAPAALIPPAPPVPVPASQVAPTERKTVPSAAQAAAEARAAAPADAPQTKVMRPGMMRQRADDGAARTQLVRGKSMVKRTEFHQDPVVAWLVVIGGPGLGAFRPIFEGNNTVGRSTGQRVPIDFGDETISSEEQAYIRYDSVDRRFLLVPNLAKTNIVAVNDTKPTSAVELTAMDVITMGHTQLVFVPFCGSDFDWGELTEMKG
jgi:hypothetical protein